MHCHRNSSYDFAGRRVWRQTFGTGAAQTVYIFDTDGHVLAEENAATGVTNKEFVWLDDMLVGMFIASGGSTAARFVTTGQIDEPLLITQSNQSVIWSGYSDPYGNVGRLSGTTGVLDLRLPGQWYESEGNASGLHQNGYRDYDPSLGRYIEADPLGIDAGANVYGYVDGDPLNEWDPIGLWICAPGASCAGVNQSIQNSLSCMDRCTGHDTVVTCGTDRHPAGNVHTLGNAVDLGHNSNPGLSIDLAGSCFTQYFSNRSVGNPEYNNGQTGGYHYHIQSIPAPGGRTGWSNGIHDYNH